MIDEYAALCPDVYVPMREIPYREIAGDVYAGLPSVPVDRAVMERTSRGAVIPSSFSWSDIGSWRLFYEFFPKDSTGNVLKGDVILRDTENSLVRSGSRLVCVNGLRNIAVIETQDVVFVSDLDRSGEAGTFAEELKGEGRKEASCPTLVHYSWGSREEIEKGESSKVTKTTLSPGKSIRTENTSSQNLRLLLLQGKALIISEEGNDELGPGQTVFLEDGANCTVENRADDVLIILEVSSVKG
jgi:mannose-6-phosphate isomerase-like protein (cupin superfamily)